MFDKKAPLSKEYYTVAYKNNKKVGTATAIIKFKGKYEGTLEKTFKIVPKGTSITKLSPKKKGFTVKYKKLKKNVSGYQIQYAKDSKFTKSAKKLTVKGNNASSKRIKGLKKGKYYVRVRTYKTVKGKKYYSSWSKANP